MNLTLWGKKKKALFYFKFCNEKFCEVSAFQKYIPSVSNSWGPSSALRTNEQKKSPFFQGFLFYEKALCILKCLTIIQGETNGGF